MIRFPYIRIANDTYPLIPIRLFGPSRSILTSALVDSGARISVFQAHLAQTIGIDIYSVTPTYLEGVGGRILGYVHTLNAEVGKHSFSCEIAFSPELLVSFSLLGRRSFFENFTVSFNESEQEVILNPV